MNNNSISKYFWSAVVALSIVAFCWYFHLIIVYVLIAVVISFIGQPLADRLSKIKIGGYNLSRGICAGIALLTMWVVFLVFIMTVIPLVCNEIHKVNESGLVKIWENLDEPLLSLGNFLRDIGILQNDEKIGKYLSNIMSSFADVTQIQSFFESIAGTVSGIFVLLFSVTFIAFFFIKDRCLFSEIVLSLLPQKYENGGQNVLNSIQKLLMRYFVGILLEMMIVTTLNTTGLTLFGFSYSFSITIGLISGFLVIVPYIGPFVALSIGVLLSLSNGMDSGMINWMPALFVMMTMLITQMLDNIIFQPWIYGNSVYAHPLEIFLVILMAGSLAGVPGMMLAIPAYTVIRVILKEFFSKLKFVEKLTYRLETKTKKE